MPNQDTRNTPTFDYMESPGVPRTCRATESRVSFPGQHDSEWEINIPGRDEWSVPFEWLPYIATDGVAAHVKFHCTSGGGKWGMNLELEYERIGGEHNQRTSAFEIYDWDGSKWKVSIQSTVRENPYTPHFDLQRVP
jgi:hypothetical protein